MLWPELDQMLRDEDDATVSTRYTAAIPEYRVVFHDPADASSDDKNYSNANGHVVYDAQHPCRFHLYILFAGSFLVMLCTKLEFICL